MRRAASIDGGKRCILSEFPMIASLAIRIACSGSILAKPSANHADATNPSKEPSCSPTDRLRLARSPSTPNRKVSSRSLASHAGLTRWPAWIAREPVPKPLPSYQTPGQCDRIARSAADLPSIIPANLANPQQILPEKNSLCPPGIQPLQLTRTTHRFQSSHPKIVCQLVPMLMLLCTAIGIGFRQPCGYP